MSEMLLYLYAETPVHAGADTSIGVIDNPIQREVSTGFPVIWGQSLKGALRERAEALLDEEVVIRLFGSPVVPSENPAVSTQKQTNLALPGPHGSKSTPLEKRRGDLAIGDAQVVAFPVPTVVNTFAWVTSELALGRLARKRVRIGRSSEVGDSLTADLSMDDGSDSARAPAGAPWHSAKEIFGLSTTPVANGNRAANKWAEILSEEAIPDGSVFKVFREKMRRDLVVLTSTDFGDNVQHGTEVTPRIALDEKKQVRDGALFYAEYLPTETILAATITLRTTKTTKEDREVLDRLFSSEVPLQIGGDETIGKGLVWLRLVKEGSDGSSGSTAS